jgi:hypothetical protein
MLLKGRRRKSIEFKPHHVLRDEYFCYSTVYLFALKINNNTIQFTFIHSFIHSLIDELIEREVPNSVSFSLSILNNKLRDQVKVE